MSPAEPRPAPLVREFRQSLIWPVQLLPRRGEAARRRPWELLLGAAGAAHSSPWQEVADDYTGDAEGFHERHYNEFVTFLPHVQRFLYGEGRQRGAGGRTGGASSMRVLRRTDVVAMSVVLAPGEAPISLQVEHIDLIFFFDVDVIALNVELHGTDLPLAQVQELLYRLGRAYPPGWDGLGRGLNCAAEVVWRAADGAELARSDSGDREAYLAFVGRQRAPRFDAHWRWLLDPLRPEMDPQDPGEAGQGASAAGQEGQSDSLRYRQIEYHRMPVMAWLAVDDPRALERADFIRLGLVTGAGGPGQAGQPDLPGPSGLPFGEQHLAGFEARHCYDRFWCGSGPAPYTRYLSCGHALVVVGSAASAFFRDRERGVLAQFRHQHFLLFLVAHFQKAALLMFSDRLVVALDALDIHDADSVKRFKRAIRGNFENFLRFTHRYWFHDVAEQAQARALYRLSADHLDLDTLYREVRERVAEMNAYLDTDSLRRQANTVIRLTVVTIVGLIGTLSTGFLGMNLLAEAEASLARRSLLFIVTVVLSVALTGYFVAKSKHLSDLLDVLSDDRLGWGDKWRLVRGRPLRE